MLKNAQTSSTVSVLKECRTTPIAFAVDKTLLLKVTNRDTVTHTLRISDKQYEIKPDTSSTITLDKRAAILGYGCDSYSPVGFLITAP